MKMDYFYKLAVEKLQEFYGNKMFVTVFTTGLPLFPVLISVNLVDALSSDL
jgi:hypothetical protein